VIIGTYFARDEIDGHSSVVSAMSAAQRNGMQVARLPLQ
jgi:hypothetical protein